MNNNRILPSYPIFAKDPMFSFWCKSEELNESNIQAWWGGEKKLYGFIKSKGETYCFLGKHDDFVSCGIKKAEQLSLGITSFTTDYEFAAGDIRLKIRFVSPLLPTDLEMISLPVCYMEYEIEGDESAEVSFFVSRNVAYNDVSENASKGVRGGVAKLNGLESAFFGLKRQLPLSNNDDLTGADWGYFYLSGKESYIIDERDMCSYLAGGNKTFKNAGEERYLLCVDSSKAGVFLFGYDDVFSIDYFGTMLKGYYLQNHTIFEAIQYVWDNRAEINSSLFAFDKDLRERAKPHGEEYINVLYASLRPSIAAHKLVRDPEGNVLFLSKECSSNGCIATVDATYPSSPLYLLYNTELLKGMMRPIMKFAKMPVWSFDFAPHDVGTYPACCGQVYGLSEVKDKYTGNLWKVETHLATHYPLYQLPASFNVYDKRYQMPVEESANLLIMWLACYRKDGDKSFFKENIELASKWVQYLVNFGLKPEDQLCTDDFAGHLKNNINLAIKATVGIAAYAELVSAIGQDGKEYRKIAENYAAQITAFGKKYSHLPLTWDLDDTTFSLKYNFAFDKILSLGLFEQDLFEKEVDCYLQRTEEYGVPLDSRESYSKVDWLIWVASLTQDKEKQNKLICLLDKYLKETPSRVPFSDWYDTKSGKMVSFIGRSVLGGCFILLL